MAQFKVKKGQTTTQTVPSTQTAGLGISQTYIEGDKGKAIEIDSKQVIPFAEDDFKDF